MKTKQKTHEPLFHVSKNDAMPMGKSLLIRVAAVIIALLIVGVLSVILIKKNPIEIYEALFTGAFIDIWTLMQNIALLLIFGLAVIPPFKMKYWNMGANGQVLVGCLAAVACMKFLPLSFPDMPDAAIIALMILSSLIASVIWAVIPALFKAYFNANETLFTLMMNYIAIAVVDCFVFNWDKSGSGNIGLVNLISRKAWFPDLGNKYVLSIIVAVVLTLIMFIYMRFTKHGFECALVGESINTAKYVGINVKKVIVRTLMFSGIICGILGALYAGSISHTVNTAVGGLGFTAILVAWLAGFDPLVMLFTSFFVVFLNSGAENVSVVFQLNSNDYANIVVGIIFFCVIGCEFFIRYRIQFNKSKKTEN